jgi:uncharacterized membrane-anchored protein YjiN (DUF445 family)
VNEEKLAVALLRKLEEAVREAQRDPDHPLRSRIDHIVIEFADKLAVGETDAVSLIETVRLALIESGDARAILRGVLRRLSETIEEEFKNFDSDLNRLMRREFQERVELFRADRAAQEKFDDWVRQIALDLVEKRHDRIGEMVRGSLEKLSDLDLVGQIESKVGRDLQYIRLNGAIVGGFAGAVLAIIKMLA